MPFPRLKGLQRAAYGGQVHEVRLHEQLVLAQAEHLAHRSHDALVHEHAAGQRDRRLHGQRPHDGGLVCLHHGVAQALEDVLHRDALLLAVDDVGLGKDGTAARQARNRLRAAHDA